MEDAFDMWHNRIAIMGGYALGSGNSIPSYIPLENYLAMIRAATDFRS